MEENLNTNGRFLRTFFLIVLAANVICFFAAMFPKNIGVYIVMFVMAPLNFLLIITGLVKVVLIQKRKVQLNYLFHYAVVILFPTLLQMVLMYLVDLFAPKGGC
jgi:uncharacterized membrane protein YhaH (DUF805 family)